MKTNHLTQSKKILDIYTSFGIQQDYEKLLEMILEEAVNFTNCDGGTLYIKDEHHLHFKIVMTKSQNIFENLSGNNPKNKNYPPVGLNMKNACAYCSMQGRIVNINDVYSSDYDFTGPKNYDKLTGYKTTSMLIFPIENDFSEVIGVVQLINALDSNGEIIPFDTYYHDILQSFGVQAGICLNNMAHNEDNVAQLNSFVEVLATAIDELSEFNSNHTNNMAVYGEKFMDWLDKTEQPLWFDQNEKNQIMMSIRLHDIGKLTTPSAILNKVTRLDDKMERVLSRIEKMILCGKVAFYQGKISEDQQIKNEERLLQALELIKSSDAQGRLEDSTIEELKVIGKQEFLSSDGKFDRILEEDELEALCVQRGNLTKEEKDLMNNHVVVTRKMLEKIKFTREYQDVMFWASSHHELLNGKGYPQGLEGKDIPIPVRLLTIIDSFEAMVASDRPYKKAKTPEEALNILRFRVKDGELDSQLVELFGESRVWE